MTPPNVVRSGMPRRTGALVVAGPTQTIALVDSFDNPALEFGDPAICDGEPVGGIDQRCEPRPAEACDIGAFELATPNPRSPFTDTAGSTFR